MTWLICEVFCKSAKYAVKKIYLQKCLAISVPLQWLDMIEILLNGTSPCSSAGRVSREWEVMGSIRGGDIPKIVKNGSSCSSAYGVELGLVDPGSGYCDWVWYHVQCLRQAALL